MKRAAHYLNERFGNRLKFYTEIRRALGIFGKIDYSIITGGYVQNERKMGDVDIITVLPYIYPHLEGELVQFVDKHVDAQIRNGFFPDFNFPSDVITRQQIRDAVSGRALEVVGGRLRLKKYSDEEIATNPEADYRVWLFEMITHDFDLARGSFEMLARDTISAHRTIFLFLCGEHPQAKFFSLDWLRREMFSIAGLAYEMSEKQCRYMLMMIEEEGFGRMGMGGKITLNINRIRQESLAMKKVISQRMAHSARHILSWDELRKKIKRRDGHDPKNL